MEIYDGLMNILSDIGFYDMNMFGPIFCEFLATILTFLVILTPFIIVYWVIKKIVGFDI